MQIDANQPQPVVKLPEMYLSNGMVLLPYRPAGMVKRNEAAPSTPSVKPTAISDRFPFVAIAAGAATSLLAMLN